MYAIFIYLLFFFNDTATTEIYTLSLHDALPICRRVALQELAADDQHELLLGAALLLAVVVRPERRIERPGMELREDRKSTRLNSSHANISYAVFCLKKKKQIRIVKQLDLRITYC